MELKNKKMNVRCLFKSITILLLLFFMIFMKTPADVQATKNFQKIFDGVDAGETVKIGKYYFYYEYSQGQYRYDPGTVVYHSDKKNSGYERLLWGNNSWTNGKTVYYFYGPGLYKYKLSTGKEILIKAFKDLGDNGNYSVQNVYNGKIYIQKFTWVSSPECSTYCYNLKKKTVNKIAKNLYFLGGNAKWIVATKDFKTDISPISFSLYKIKGSKLKKVKKLTDNGYFHGFKYNKIFYSTYKKKDYSLASPTLYQCNQNGKKKKKLATIKSGNQIIIERILNKKACRVRISSLDTGANETHIYYYKKKKWMSEP